MNSKKLQISSFKTSDKTTFEECRLIRTKVFIQEQEVDERDEFDDFESESVHYVMRLDGKAIGTARWRKTENGTKLERFAVLKNYRGKKYGDKMLQRVIDDAKIDSSLLYLHAQLTAVPFYERRGFVKIGEQFEECAIWHYKMILDLS